MIIGDSAGRTCNYGSKFILLHCTLFYIKIIIYKTRYSCDTWHGYTAVTEPPTLPTHVPGQADSHVEKEPPDTTLFSLYWIANIDWSILYHTSVKSLSYPCLWLEQNFERTFVGECEFFSHETK